MHLLFKWFHPWFSRVLRFWARCVREHCRTLFPSQSVWRLISVLTRFSFDSRFVCYNRFNRALLFNAAWVKSQQTKEDKVWPPHLMVAFWWKSFWWKIAKLSKNEKCRTGKRNASRKKALFLGGNHLRD